MGNVAPDILLNLLSGSFFPQAEQFGYFLPTVVPAPEVLELSSSLHSSFEVLPKHFSLLMHLEVLLNSSTDIILFLN